MSASYVNSIYGASGCLDFNIILTENMLFSPKSEVIHF